MKETQESPMHGQPLDEAQAAGFGTPPPRAVTCPIVDVHTHMTEPATNHELVEAARRYGVTRLGAITTLEEGLALKLRYPREIEIVARPPLAPPPGKAAARDGRPPEDRALELIPRAAANGVRIIKFWFAPRIRDRLDFLFDSPRLD